MRVGGSIHDCRITSHASQTNTMAAGTHGHWHGAFIDGDPESEHRDRRVLQKHLHARSNVRDRAGMRSYPSGRPLPGVRVTTTKDCTRCGVTKDAREFQNHAVGEDLRSHDGFNIVCRSCQTTQYVATGYKKDGFVVDDADASDSEYSDSDEDSDEDESEDELESDSDDEVKIVHVIQHVRESEIQQYARSYRCR